MDVEKFVDDRLDSMYLEQDPLAHITEIVTDAIAQDRKERIREEWATETKEYVPVWLKTCPLEEKALASQFWWYAKDLILRDRKERGDLSARLERLQKKYPLTGDHAEDGRYIWPKRWKALSAVDAALEETEKNA